MIRRRDPTLPNRPANRATKSPNASDQPPAVSTPTQSSTTPHPQRHGVSLQYQLRGQWKDESGCHPRAWEPLNAGEFRCQSDSWTEHRQAACTLICYRRLVAREPVIHFSRQPTVGETRQDSGHEIAGRRPCRTGAGGRRVMARPAVGAALRRCTECSGYEYSGAPACTSCRALVDSIVEEEWSALLRHWDVSSNQEVALAESVAAEPDRHDWRVVDAALDRLVCSACGSRLSRGPVGCSACDLAHGFRYSAIETDRPGVPPGNEHAVRVNVSVVRRPQITSEKIGRAHV